MEFQSLIGNPINCDGHKLRSDCIRKVFQSLIGNPINCDRREFISKTWVIGVSIPNRESNQLRLYRGIFCAYICVFQSLIGNPINCD